jgi:hypothetical protein
MPSLNQKNVIKLRRGYNNCKLHIKQFLNTTQIKLYESFKNEYNALSLKKDLLKKASLGMLKQIYSITHVVDTTYNFIIIMTHMYTLIMLFILTMFRNARWWYIKLHQEILLIVSHVIGQREKNIMKYIYGTCLTTTFWFVFWRWFLTMMEKMGSVRIYSKSLKNTMLSYILSPKVHWNFYDNNVLSKFWEWYPWF